MLYPHDLFKIISRMERIKHKIKKLRIRTSIQSRVDEAGAEGSSGGMG